MLVPMANLCWNSMKTVCAWCGSVISDGNDPISHGICQDCRKIMLFEEEHTLQSFIDSIPVPIVVLNSSLLPMCSNRTGMERFHLVKEEVAHCTLGEVVECENSRLPGGCGKTAHCSACVLRRTVTETYETGRRSAMLPAKLMSESKEIWYYVSTIKVGDCVVVKLDTRPN